MNVTLVTMFFNLNQARPKQFYIDHGRAVLELDAPMVVFCDAETRPDLEACRNGRPTAYVERPIFEYEYYSALLPIVHANRATRPSPDTRNTPEYFLLSMFKFYALYFAYLRRDFPCTHYMWIDIGCSHVVRGIPSAILPILAAPRPKVACCYIHYRSSAELYPMTSYFASGGKCGLAAGLMTLESSYVPKLFTLANSILYEQIAEGVGHAEEQVLVYCYDRRPEWFSIYAGDYYSIATNYHRAVNDIECIEQNFIRPAMAAGRHDLVQSVRMRLLVLVISGGDNPVYTSHKEVWRSYMKKTPGVDVYFLEAGTPAITDDTITCAGTESWGGILGKTLDALKTLPVHAYTYVLRTNLSSLWNFRKLLDLIETFPRQGLYAGCSGTHGCIPFVSGAGILMSADVCATLLQYESEARELVLPDDVMIGKVLVSHGISFGPILPRVDILTPDTPFPLDGIHYRVKMEGNRSHEPGVMKTILKER